MTSKISLEVPDGANRLYEPGEQVTQEGTGVGVGGSSPAPAPQQCL